MMTPASDTLAKFCALYEELNIKWRGIEVRTVCFKMGPDWINGGTCVQPKTGERELDLPSFKSEVRLDSLSCLTETVEARGLPRLLESMFNGVASVAGVTIDFRQVPPSGDRRLLSPTFRFQPREWSKGSFGIDFPSYVLEATSSESVINTMARTEYDELDRTLFSLER